LSFLRAAIGRWRAELASDAPALRRPDAIPGCYLRAL